MKSILRFFIKINLLCTISVISLKAQVKHSRDVIGSAGTVSSTNEITLEWTLGESFVATNKLGNAWYTQGFHQPVLFVRSESKEMNHEHYRVRIYPNPVLELLNVEVRSGFLDPILIKLIDVTGRVVLTQKASGGHQDLQLRLNHLPDGMYLLSMVGKEGILIKSYKVIKH
jgi:hypothetical protein